jgi:F-type H+-transporting ATPase subunit epsilon
MIRVEITTPDESVFSGEAMSVSLPTMDGEITVLAGHIPLVSIVVPGTAVIRDKDGEHLMAVTRGVIEIDGDAVKVLVQSADRVEGLEEEAIEAAKARAQKLMSERRDDSEGFAEATALLERELAKLQVVRRNRTKRSFRDLPR